MEKRVQSEGQESVVGPSVKIDGDLKSQGNIRIDGSVTGKVKTSQNVYIGESANLAADVDAENVVVAGIVQGNIKAAVTLILTPTARVLGDLNCGSLQVEEGAYFAGKCQMKDRGDLKPVAEDTPEIIQEKQEKAAEKSKK